MGHDMLGKLIQFSLLNRYIVLGLAGFILILGMWRASQLPVEVLPDLTRPTVTILTESPGLAPEEVETLVTIPLESAVMSIPGVTRIRTISDVSLSMTYVEFNWDTDISIARRKVQERIQTVNSTLPDKITPYMSPVSSLMGEIMLIGLSSRNNKTPSSEIRWIADWSVRRKLLSIPGVSEVLSIGGGIRQIQVQPKPKRMRAFGISFDQIKEAIANAVSNTTGGFLVNRDQEIMVRHLAMTAKLENLSETVITHDGDRPITIGDVAEVKWEIQQMRGDAAINGDPGVIISVTKSPGLDTTKLSESIKEKLNSISNGLPDDIVITPLFDQADFIKLAIGNLKDSLQHGAIIVTLVLIFFISNVRTTLITLMAIPLSFATTCLVFDFFNISVNSMTLGGLAVSLGIVVDDAIVDVENVFRRLKQNARSSSPQNSISVIMDASKEVRKSILFATLLIIISFIPLLGLYGLSGRLFKPIALATITSMVASFIVSLTIIPVLCSFLLSKFNHKKAGENFFVRSLKYVFKKTWLKISLDSPIPILVIAGILLSFAISIYPMFERDFLPRFKEESLLIALTAAPGTSLEKTNELSDVADRLLKTIPEIKSVGRRVGRAEHGDHVVPVSTVEFDIVLNANGRSREVVIDEIRKKMKTIPGTFSAMSGPLADRIGHMLSGVNAPIAVKIFGPDLNKLKQIADSIRDVARDIPGLESAQTEQQAPIPQLRIELNRQRAKAFGFTPGHINKNLASLMNGETLAKIYLNERSVDLVMRLSDEWRENPSKLADIYFQSINGNPVPLYKFAAFNKATGPNVIHRENTLRRAVVSIKPTTGGIEKLVEDLKDDVTQKVKLPEGYSISYEGEFKARQSAIQRIVVFSIISLITMVILLFLYFRTLLFPLQVIGDIILSSTGGLTLSYLVTGNLSISTIVGLIAVAGIGARNSLMMLSHYLHLLKHEGEKFSRSMVERGAQERLVPVLMTALSAGLALLPIIWASDQPGKEILYPVAVAITGGLVTSTLLGLGVTPALFFAFGKRSAEKAIEKNAPACD